MLKGIKKATATTLLILIVVMGIMAYPLPVNAQQYPTVRIGFLTCPDSFYAWLPKLKGWDHEFGVNYELVRCYTGPEIINLLLSGDIDIGQLGSTPVIITNNRPGTTLPVVSINVYVTAVHEFYANPALNATDLRDLVGKKGAFAFGTNLEFMFRLACKDYGLDPDTDFELYNMMPPDAMTALMNGEVDFAGVWFPYGKMLADEGFTLVLNGEWMCDWEYGSTFCPIYALSLARPEFANEHPELITLYIALTLRAQEYGREHLQEVAEISTEYLQSLGSVYSVESFLFPFQTGKFVPIVDIDGMLRAFDEMVNVFTKQSQFWAEMGAIPEDFRDPAEYVNSTFAVDLKNIEVKAFNSIQNAKNEIQNAKAAGKDVSEAESLLEQAEEEYSKMNYLKAYTLAEQAIDLMAEKPLLSPELIAVIVVVIVVVALAIAVYALRKRRKS
ncbi:MAG: ABC transporter substrate-binding protein [Candidatus Baldrarchaeia archaeon]